MGHNPSIQTAEIDDAAVTLAKMADMATASLIGRDTAGTGVPEVLPASTVLTLLGLESVVFMGHLVFDLEDEVIDTL